MRPQLLPGLLVCMLVLASPSAVAQEIDTIQSGATNSNSGTPGSGGLSAQEAVSPDKLINSAIEELSGSAPNMLEPKSWTSPEGLSSSLKIMLLLTALTVAPAVLLMTTCFIRVLVVLGLLRQAIGAQQLPPSQVITSLALFITILVMTPVWTEAYQKGIEPYRNKEISWEEAWKRTKRPLVEFMGKQIENAQNVDDVVMFFQYHQETTNASESEDLPEEYEDLPIQVLLPAYVLSELKTAFLIGFQVYLPFLVLDIVISSVTISMGMFMLPPVMISLPFKIMLFVLVDGWRLVVQMLLESVTIPL